MKRSRLIVVLGPTASGKSALAVGLAKRLGTEVISADSRQVYRGLNLGTGKITPKEMSSVPHHLLDVVSPKKRFSASDYKRLGDRAIHSIEKKNKIPIIVGGTGLYIDTLVGRIVLPDVPPNKTLRKNLEKKSTRELFTILKKLDPYRAKSIDRNNKVRLVRAIEVARVAGKAPRNWRGADKYDVLYIGLLPKDLDKKIEIRLKKRLDHGLISEVRELHKNGLSWRRMEELGLEYRYASLFLQKKMTKVEMIDRLNTEIKKYAKRQMTWFKLNKQIVWLDPDKRSGLKRALTETDEFWKMGQKSARI